MLSSIPLHRILNSSTVFRHRRVDISLLTTKTKRRYSKVLVRDVPNSMAEALSMSSSPTTLFDLPKAKSQHESYLQIMKTIFSPSNNNNIIHLKADDTYPDCVFIEDTAVVIDNRAVICRIGAKSRRGEVDETKKALLHLGLEVFDMRQDTDSATCDGGDVLYPVTYNNNNQKHDSTNNKRGGKHLFVGISNRTNHEGAKYLQKKFPHVKVIPIQLKGEDTKNEVLHLKSAVTHVDEKTLLVPIGCEWNFMVDIFLKEHDFQIVRLPEIAACNVVSVNGHILAPNSICETSKEILHETIVQSRGLSLHFIEANEFAKYDGALTCKSILIP